MKQPTLLEDLRDTIANWHDAEFRKGFIRGFLPTIPRILASIVFGLLIGFIISRALP